MRNGQDGLWSRTLHTRNRFGTQKKAYASAKRQQTSSDSVSGCPIHIRDSRILLPLLSVLSMQLLVGEFYGKRIDDDGDNNNNKQ